MKKAVALLAFTFGCATLFAQEKESKFSLSAFVSPTIAYRTYSAADSIDDYFVEFFKKNEKPKAGYSTGLLASYAVHKKFRIQAGISFSNNGYLHQKHDLVTDTNYYPTPIRIPTAVRIIYQNYFIDIPVQMKYTFLTKKKIRLYALAGMEANFNVANKSTAILWHDDGKERQTQKDNFNGNKTQKYNCSVTGGIGLDIILSQKINLFVQPTFRYMLLPFVDAPITRKYYSAGLAMGVNINI